jgi:hypothetical protein
MEALHSLANEVCCSIAVQDQAQVSTSCTHLRSCEVEKQQHEFNYNIDNPYLQGATYPFHQTDQALHPQMVNQLTPPFSEMQSFQLLYPLIPSSPRSQESQLNTSNNIEMFDLQPLLDPEEAKRSRLETLERFHEMVDVQGSVFGHPIVDNSPLTEDDTDISTGESSSFSSQLCCDSTSKIENSNLFAESQSSKKVETVCLLSSSSAQSDNQAEEEVVIRITLPFTPATPLRPSIPPTPLTPIRSPLNLQLSTPVRSYQPRKSSKPKKIVLKVAEETTSNSSSTASINDSMEIQSSSSVDELPIGPSPCKSVPKIPPYEISETDSIGPHCSTVGLTRIHIEKGGFHGGVKLPGSQLTNGVAIELSKYIRESKAMQRKDFLRLLPRLFDIEPLDFENTHLVKRFFERLITPISIPAYEPPRTRSSSGSIELPYTRRNSSTESGRKTDNATLRRAEFEAKQFLIPADLINMTPTKPRQNPRLVEIKQHDSEMREQKSRASKPTVKLESKATTPPEPKPRNVGTLRVKKSSMRKPTLSVQMNELREEMKSEREKTNRRMELLERRLELSERSKAGLIRSAAHTKYKVKILEMKLASRSKKQFKRRRANVQKCKSFFKNHYNICIILKENVSFNFR